MDPQLHVVHDPAPLPEKVPADHVKQFWWIESLYVPAVHWEQLDAPAPLTYPELQVVHEDDPAVEYVPADQVKQFWWFESL